ncbi:hypothetical protein GCM10009595_04360 [Falsarthrobacter nasiphocae]
MGHARAHSQAGSLGRRLHERFMAYEEGEGRPWVAIWQGFTGSMMMLVASFGVGWLPNASYSVASLAPVIWMRYELAGVITSILLLVFGGMLLVRSWLRLGSRLGDFAKDGTAAAVRNATLLWSAPLAFSLPLFSRDVFAYIAQGLMVTNGLNPYKDSYSQITGYLQIGADDLWSQSPTPYGPVWLWLESWAVFFGQGNPLPSIAVFRLLAIVGFLLMWWGVTKMAALHHVNVPRAVFLSVTNPLVLTTFIASIHNDALMMGCVLVGLYLVARKKPILGIAVFTLSIGIKPITVLLLPFIGLMWAGPRASWRRKLVFAGLATAYSLGLMAILGFIVGGGFGWVAALKTPGTVWIWYAPVGMLGFIVGALANALGLDGASLTDLVYLGAKVVGLLVVARVFFVGKDAHLVRRMGVALAAVVLSSSMIQGWYVVWLLPLFAVSGVRSDWQYKVLSFVTPFFVAYSLCDQLDIFPYLTGIDLTSARNFAAVLVLAFCVYLVAIDSKTKHLFNIRWPSLSQMRELGVRARDAVRAEAARIRRGAEGHTGTDEKIVKGRAQGLSDAPSAPDAAPGGTPQTPSRRK